MGRLGRKYQRDSGPREMLFRGGVSIRENQILPKNGRKGVLGSRMGIARVQFSFVKNEMGGGELRTFTAMQ